MTSNTRYSLRHAIRQCLRGIFLFISDSTRRAAIITRLKFGNYYFQHEIFTKENRYPEIFGITTRLLSHIEKPEILSFGCATGEEVKTLSDYFPLSDITGVDINKRCLLLCREKYTDPRFKFLHRFSDQFLASGNFDIIFSMAVFQHTANRLREDITKTQIITFEQFSKEVELLDRKLKIGGILVIVHCDFNFMDTACSKKYQVLKWSHSLELPDRHIFDTKNQKLPNYYEIPIILSKIK